MHGFVINPEVAVAISVHQLCEAMALKRDMAVIEDFEKFRLRQAFLIVIGGVYYRSPPPTSPLAPEQVYHSPDPKLFPVVSSPSSQKDIEQQNQQNGNNLSYHCLTPKKLHYLAKTGQIRFEEVPKTSVIDDRSKTDWTLKSISMFQSLWFIANVIFRLVFGYEIALLEVIATAFALCGFIQLLAWIRCPQDVRTPFLRTLQKPELDNIGSPTPRHLSRWMLRGKIRDISPLRWLTVTISTTLSAAISLAAWNYPFTSVTERRLWRLACVLPYISEFSMMPIEFSKDMREYLKIRGTADNRNASIADESDIESVADADNEATKGLTTLQKCGKILNVILAVVASYTRTIFLCLACTAFIDAPSGIYKAASWADLLPHL